MIILILIVLLSIVLLANVGEEETWARDSVYLLILALNGSMVVFGLWSLLSSRIALPANVIPDPAFYEAFTQVAQDIGLTALAAASISSLLLLKPIRRLLTGGLRRLRLGQLDATSPVHTVAMVFSIYLLAGMMVQWLLAGGVSGLVELGGMVLLTDVLLSGVIAVAFALLGVGLGVRRNWQAAFERLGLSLADPNSLLIGVLGAGLLLGFLIATSALWLALAPESFAELGNATSDLFGGLTSFPAALVVALSTAIGEELLFRGALQPRLGLLPTSVLFALLHLQYTLSPAWLIIFGVGLGLGLLRLWRGTTAAMVAHFVYNFALLTLASASQG